MAILARSQSDVYGTLISQMQGNGVIVTSDPTITGLTEVFSARISELYTNQEVVVNGVRLTIAGGSNLDILAQDKGMSRFRSNTIADLTSANFKFYLPAGKTGKDYAVDINLPLVIPTGQMITGGVWTFYTTSTAIIYPDENSGYCGIQASVRKDTDVNVNLLTTHNVYLPSIANIDVGKSPELFCTNDKTIIVQPQLESDAALRLRIFNRVNAMNNTNEDAIRLALKDIGITDVSFRKDMFGIGTVGVELLTGGAILSDTILDAADGVIKRIAPYGRVIRPEYMSCQMCFSISLNNYDQKEETLATILTDIYTYFDNLLMGATLNVTTLLRTVTVINNVKAVKLATLKIDGRRVAITNQIASPTERFVALENSIDFTVL